MEEICTEYYSNSLIKIREGRKINGKRTGKGAYYYHNGDSYKGDFKNGDLEGNGEYVWSKLNERYKGEWKVINQIYNFNLTILTVIIMIRIIK